MSSSIKAIFVAFTLTGFFACTSAKGPDTKSLQIRHDAHVHIMSPEMVEDWKALGIPFSKSESDYFDIDTILANVGAESIDLIGMGYIYSNPDFYQGNDQHARLRKENDYLHLCVMKHPDRITPFYAINPLTAYGLEEMNRCIDSFEMKGLKLHFSSSQVYLTEPEQLEKVKAIFELAAKNGMAILLHFDNWHPKFGKTDLKILNDSILNVIPPIELRIAHFGTSGGFSQKTRDFLEAFIDMKERAQFSKEHKILLDISAVALDKDSEGVSKLTDTEFEQLKGFISKIGEENIIFATDYPLYNADEYAEVLKSRLTIDVENLYEGNK